MTKRYTLDDVIEELIRTNKFDEFMKKLETEGIEIDPNVDITPTISSLGKDGYNFDIGEMKYELTYETFVFQNKKTFAEINFKLKNLKQLKNLQKSDDFLETGITGTGSPFKVLSAVVSRVVKIVKNKLPDYITFQARETKRQKLYVLMIKYLLKTINLYKPIDISPLTNDKFDESEFWLEKI